MKKIIFLLLFINSQIFGAYIDDRDMSSESQKIQRLLGKLDAINAYPRNSGNNATPYAMLTLATAGLAVVAASSSHSHYYSYYPRYYSSYHDRRYRPSYNYYRPRNDVGTAIGATMITAGLIGAIASAATAEQAQDTQRVKADTEKQINDIINNLITTDLDFINEKDNLRESLIKDTDNKILAIERKTSNDINILKKDEQTVLSNFHKLTNTLQDQISTLEKDTIKYISQNIEKISDSNTSSSGKKELQKLNKELKKQSAKKTKEIQKQIKIEIKQFNKSFPATQRTIAQTIESLETAKKTQIINELDFATKTENSLFEKYKNLYVQKLSVY